MLPGCGPVDVSGELPPSRACRTRSPGTRVGERSELVLPIHARSGIGVQQHHRNPLPPCRKRKSFAPGTMKLWPKGIPPPGIGKVAAGDWAQLGGGDAAKTTAAASKSCVREMITSQSSRSRPRPKVIHTLQTLGRFSDLRKATSPS